MNIPNTKSIGAFFHCGLCFNEYAARVPDAVGISPAQYQRLEAGFTDIGVQVWCRRHDCNVIHIDFQGKKHPANIDRAAD